MSIYTDLIFCFICRLWSLVHWGPRERGEWGRANLRSHDGCSTRRLLACMTKRLTQPGESGHSFTHSLQNNRRCCWNLSEVTEPDVVQWCREEQCDIQYIRAEPLSQRTLEWHLLQNRRKTLSGNVEKWKESGRYQCKLLPFLYFHNTSFYSDIQSSRIVFRPYI